MQVTIPQWSPSVRRTTTFAVGPPRASDGGALAWLVQDLPPLEPNTPYCYALLANHFAATCAIAHQGRAPLGCALGYRVPGRADTLFVWQVGVAEFGRGRGLGTTMLLNILGRPVNADVRYLEATVAPDNGASQRLFEGIAVRLEAPLQWQPFLEPHHFAPFDHETENLVRIGPLRPRVAPMEAGR